MAKGENLEKPKKKGGMVIVIGMGAKPKDSMKKSFGRGSDDAKLAGRSKLLNRLRSGRLNIDDILGKRKIDPDEFHGEFRRRHNMDFEDYLKEKGADIDVQAMLDELAEKRFGAAKKTAIEGRQRRENRAKQMRENLLNTSKFKGMLRNQGIDENQWKRAVNKIPMNQITRNTFNELIDKLGRGKPRPSRQSRERNTTTHDGPAQSYDEIFAEHGNPFDMRGEDEEEEMDADAQDRRVEDKKGGRRKITMFDRERGEGGRGQGFPGGSRLYQRRGMAYNQPDVAGTARGEVGIKDELPQGSDEEQRALEFYERLYSHHRNPMQSALQQLGRGTVSDQNRQDIEEEFREGSSGPDTTPSTVFTKPNAPPGFRAGSPDEDEDPNVGFDARSIGATTPKKDTANPRELNDPRSTRAGQGEEQTIRPFRMQTSFDDPMNVMDAAWALLKGNPDMTDMSGDSVPPAAMNYAQQARALEDSLEYQGGKRRGVAAPEMMADENTSRFAEKLNKPRFARKKVGGETMQEHHDFARERSKRDTSEYMDEGDFGADPHIQRMPRPAP